MTMLYFLIGMCILLLFIVILFLMYRIYQNRKNVRIDVEQQSAMTIHCDESLLKFDQEIDLILNDPHLSDAEKERLTNQCAEKYVHMIQSHPT